MEGDLWQKVLDLAEENDKLVKRLRESGLQLAKWDTEYRKALSVAELQMNSEGYPVTITRDTCRGLPHIAKLRLRRECAKAVHDATQEAINNNKLKIRVLEAQNAREWSQAGGSYL